VPPKPSHAAETRPDPARAGYAPPGVPCPICRQPLPAGRRVCSAKCRAVLSRRRRVEVQAVRDAEIRRHAEAIIGLLDEGRTR
jgi:predicted nucleic acid-binding Zn ribbon protein